jgi:transposase
MVIGMRKKHIITSEMAAEIRWKIKEYEKTRAFRKLQFVMMIGEGIDIKTAAKIAVYHVKWGYELIKQYCEKGFDEYIRDGRGGANNKNLTDEQEDELLDKFREKAESGKVVHLSQIKKEYDNAVGKETANSTFYSFLGRKEWRRVMPRGTHPKKASDEVIEASKKLTLN